VEHKSAFDLFGNSFIKPEQISPVRKAAKTKLVSGTNREDKCVRRCMHYIKLYAHRTDS